MALLMSDPEVSKIVSKCYVVLKGRRTAKQDGITYIEVTLSSFESDDRCDRHIAGTVRAFPTLQSF